MVRIKLADGLAQPAFGDDLIGLAGVPDIHAPEVRTIGVGIANTLDDGHLSGVIEFLQRPGARVKRQRVVEGQDLLDWNPHRWPRVVVNAIGIWNDRIHEIIAPAQLHHHQHRGFNTYGHSQLPPRYLTRTDTLSRPQSVAARDPRVRHSPGVLLGYRNAARRHSERSAATPGASHSRRSVTPSGPDSGPPT